MVGESQKPIEGKHHLEFLCSSAGADANVPGELGSLPSSILFRGGKCGWTWFELDSCLFTHSSWTHQDFYPSTHFRRGCSESTFSFHQKTVPHMFFIYWLVSLCLGCPSWVSGAPWGPGINGRESGASVWGAASRVYEPASLWTQSTLWGAPAKHQDTAAELRGCK